MKKRVIGMMRKMGAGLLMAALIFAASVFSNGVPSAYAAGGISVDPPNESVTQGSTASLVFELTNNGTAISAMDKARLSFPSGSGLTATDYNFGATNSFPVGAKSIVGFNVTAENTAATGPVSAKIELMNGTAKVGETESIIIRIAEKSTTSNSLTGYRVYNADVSFTTNHGTSLETGDDNTITFRIKNSGTTSIKNCDFALYLPEGVSVGSGHSNVEKLGSFSAGASKELSFPVSVEKGLYKKNYSFSVKITGTGFGANSSDESVSVERSFSVYVDGTKDVSGEEEEEGSLNDIELSLSTVPEAGLATGDGNSLRFTLKNGGEHELKNVSMLLDLPEGVSITSGGASSASLGSLKAGESREISYPVYVEKGLYKKNYALRADFSGSNGSSSRSFYVYVDGTKSLDENGDETGESKNPQIMVQSFSYGGGSVLAGNSFNLGLVLYNTSDRNLKNIKVTGSSDGNFVPSGSSSFYVEGVKAKGSFQGSLGFTAAHDATQEAHAITVHMSYEDADGNSYTAEDTVSVPVVQKLRFTVEDVEVPSDLFVGEQSYASVSYYNMGKTQVSNLRIRVEGEGFDMVDARSSYIGNVASGASDDFSFNFTPTSSEPVSGKIVFIYEDVTGQQMTDEVPFSFTAQEMQYPEDNWNDDFPTEPVNNGPNWKLYAGIAAGVIVALIILRRILKKRKLNKQLELEDEE